MHYVILILSYVEVARDGTGLPSARLASDQITTAVGRSTSLSQLYGREDEIL